jgi:hypothetical protein
MKNQVIRLASHLHPPALDILVEHISVDGAKSILFADIFYFNC